MSWPPVVAAGLAPADLVVDIGTGTGSLARLLSARGARVVGLDPAATLLEQARSLDGAAGSTVDYAIGIAEQLVLEHNPSWNGAGGTGIYPAWTSDVSEAGFIDMSTFSFDSTVSYSHERWRGRVRASAGVGGSLAPAAVERFDRQLTSLLLTSVPDPFDEPHRTWALTCRTPG